MPPRKLCIHGHFYQPPREDPWLDEILPEGSAAPFLNWNERICRESYGPLGWARRLDGAGRIMEMVNCYSWMSFNFGPTLMRWIERAQPETYARILQGDRESVARWGHGNAMAQIYHHVIMPLAHDDDKKAEVAWAVADFQSRYGRDPEGMWLSEAAVDTPSLEVLADAGIRFVILAPRQAEAVAWDNGDDYRPVNEWDVDVYDPYLAELPSGRSMSVFFYNGPISQSVAFEGLLKDGERFWGKIRDNARDGLLSVGTDGETYGHHFAFGEMALAYVLAQAMSERDEISLTNYAAYLAANPPRRKVRIRERSSWSCVHGVERWRSDCGCCAGGHPGWNQAWRGPLRQAVELVRTTAREHFTTMGAKIFKDCLKALCGYGRVVCGLDTPSVFARKHFKPKLAPEAKELGWRLLAMQKWGLASQASCAWFFDDIGRIESLNAMGFALRSLEIGRRTGMKDVEGEFAAILAKARSNEPALGTGRDLLHSQVKTRQESPVSLAAQALAKITATEGKPKRGRKAVVSWVGVDVEVAIKTSGNGKLTGSAVVTWRHEPPDKAITWFWDGADSEDPLAGEVRMDKGLKTESVCAPKRDLAWRKQQSVAMAWVRKVEEAQWDREFEAARTGLNLFLAYQESQVTQGLAPLWRRFWAALAYQWIVLGPAMDRERGQCLVEFLRKCVEARGKAQSELLAIRLAARMLAALEQGSKGSDELAGMLARCRDLGLETDLWTVQNRFNDLPNPRPDLASLLGFMAK